MPEGIKLLKFKLVLASVRTLTSDDDKEVDACLNNCCENHPRWCGWKADCKRLHNILGDYLPIVHHEPERVRQRKSVPGEWMGGTLHYVKIHGIKVGDLV